MKVRLSILAIVLSLTLNCLASAQTTQAVNDGPLAVSDFVAIFGLKATDEELNRVAIDWVRKRCVNFIDDGTNYWVVRTLGGSEELIKEVDRCLPVNTRNNLVASLRITDKVQVHRNQRNLVDVLIRLLYAKKDVAGRKKFIVAGKEFMRRYSEDRDVTELLQWLKETIPKQEQKVAGVHF